MGSSELETAYKNWAKRVAQYTQLGIPQTAYGPIAQQDMHKVATNQGGAMNNEQAAAAVYAAASKINPIQSQQSLQTRHRAGLLGGLEDFVGNVGSDIGHIITGAPAGIGHLVASVATPGGLKRDWHDIQAAGSDIAAGDLGKALRDAAAVPVLGAFVPGLADVADLTTAAGRSQLLSHPVSAALDVLPFTKGATALAGAKVGAQIGSDSLKEALGQASNWDKIRGTDVRSRNPLDPRTEDPSATAAAAAGRPIQAGLRLVDRQVLAKLGDRLAQAGPMRGGAIAEHTIKARDRGEGLPRLGPGQLAIRRAGARTGASAAARRMGTLMGRAELLAKQEADRKVKQVMGDAHLKLSNQKLADISEKVQLGDRAALDAEGRDIYDRLDAYRFDEEARFEQAKEGMNVPGAGFYSEESKVPRYYRAVSQFTRGKARATDRLAKAESRYADAQSRLNRAQQDIHGRQRAAAEAAQTAGERSAVARHSAAQDGVVKAEGRYAAAQAELNRAEMAIHGRQRTAAGPLPTGRVYATESQQARLESARGRATSAAEERRAAQAEAAAAEAELRSARRYPPSGTMVATAEQQDRLNAARGEVNAATAARQKARARHDLADRALTKGRTRFEKQILKEPPRHLHPKIQQIIRGEVTKTATADHDARRAALAKAGDMRVLAAYEHAYKRMHTTPVMDQLELLVGKDEFRKISESAVMAAIGLEHDGHIAPVYMTTVYSHDLPGVMSPRRLAQERDVREAQSRKAMFKMQPPLFNVVASLTKEQAEASMRANWKEVHDKYVKPLGVAYGDIRENYLASAERRMERGRHYIGEDINQVADKLMAADYTRWDFDQYGIRHRPTGGQSQSTDIYLPTDLVKAIESFMGTDGNRVGLADHVLENKLYRGGMRLFRVSVLYGPRHFAHVVVGGMVSTLAEEPRAIRQFPKLFPVFMDIAKGRDVRPIDIAGRPASPVTTTHFNYKTDAFYKALDTKVGQRYADLLKDYWAKMHLPTGERLAAVENAAQSIYQLAIQLEAVKRGLDPLMAFEKSRQVVVNMEGMTAFERTVMKQVMPFYTFQRYAVRYLWNLPFDHPLRVSILSNLANQATEEWGTGLPQTMMTLFFFGHTDPAGNVLAVNLRNANPFRSVANMFTWGGFFSSLNPAITSTLTAAGFNPLSGSGQLYPELTYDPTSGTLKAMKAPGGLMAAAEQVVPELGGLDALFGLSNNYRYLRQNDPQGFERQIMNDFNIPFQISQYNLPQVRGRVAVDTLRAATQAVTAYKKGGRYADTIGKYSLIPYNGQMIPPDQFENYWQGLKAKYGSASNIPSPPQTTANPLANITQYYNQQQAQ